MLKRKRITIRCSTIPTQQKKRKKKENAEKEKTNFEQKKITTYFLPKTSGETLGCGIDQSQCQTFHSDTNTDSREEKENKKSKRKENIDSEKKQEEMKTKDILKFHSSNQDIFNKDNLISVSQTKNTPSPSVSSRSCFQEDVNVNNQNVNLQDQLPPIINSFASIPQFVETKWMKHPEPCLLDKKETSLEIWDFTPKDHEKILDMCSFKKKSIEKKEIIVVNSRKICPVYITYKGIRREAHQWYFICTFGYYDPRYVLT